MLVLTKISAIRNEIARLKTRENTIGLVPTMGALHEGHLSLVRTSKAQCDITIVSIFINPIQFNNDEDLARYPRTLDEDLDLLNKENVDILFAPSTDEIYPDKPTIQIDFDELERVMEGKFRPGHFKGVAIVVSKLFNIITPDYAFFGQKDFQQLQIIRKLQKELSFPVEIVAVPTVREPNGLAMSSRNRRLSNRGLEVAGTLYRSLKKAEKMLLDNKEPSFVIQEISRDFENNPEVKLEYFEIVEPENLQKFETISDYQDVAMCIAAYIEGIRLIDNLYLRLKSKG